MSRTGARQHAFDDEAADRLAQVGSERRPAARRLQPDEAALARRDADRAAAVVGVRARHHARGDRRRRAAARAAGRVRRVPRIARRPVGVRLGRRQHAELGHVGAPEEDEPRGAELASRGRSRAGRGSRAPSGRATPKWIGSPAVWPRRSFSRNGTPRNGPSGRAFRRPGRAPARRSDGSPRSASGSRRSMRAMAASTSSRGLALPLRTSSACAVASRRERSSAMVRLTTATGGCPARFRGPRVACAAWHDDPGFAMEPACDRDREP